MLLELEGKEIEIREPVVCDAAEIKKSIDYIKTLLTKEQIKYIKNNYQFMMYKL